jgi:hypothetical protein
VDWRQIQAEHRNIIVPVTAAPELPSVAEDIPLPTPLITPARTIPAALNALKFGSRPPSARPLRRREESPTDVQFSLF